MSDAPDTCPRCGRAFRCGVADAAPCPCTTLQLSALTQASLRDSYAGCLCTGCLAELAATEDAAASP